MRPDTFVSHSKELARVSARSKVLVLGLVLVRNMVPVQEHNMAPVYRHFELLGTQPVSRAVFGSSSSRKDRHRPKQASCELRIP